MELHDKAMLESLKKKWLQPGGKLSDAEWKELRRLQKIEQKHKEFWMWFWIFVIGFLVIAISKRLFG